MLHSALFVATIPDDRSRWSNVINNLDRQAHQPSAAIERLADNVWLLRFPEALPALADLISRSTQFGVAYRILPFGAEPQWLRGDPSPAPNPAARAGQP